MLKVPDRDHDASEQWHHLERVLDRKHDYTGGVVFAGEMRRLRDDLALFCRNRGCRWCSPTWKPSSTRPVDSPPGQQVIGGHGNGGIPW